MGDQPVSFTGLMREPLKPFPCPACDEYLSSDAAACRHCGAQIDPVYAGDAARRQTLANWLYRKKHYAKHVRRGGALFLLGVAVAVGSYCLFPVVLKTDFVWIPRGLVLGGGGDFLYGVWGLASEARNAKVGAL